MRESKHDLRGACMFKKHLVRTNAKYHFVTIKGVNVWKNCSEEMKTYGTLIKFKNSLKIIY